MNKEPMREHPADDDVARVRDLETRAAAARERLLRAAVALDARRRQVVRIGTEAKRMALPAILSVAAVGALFGASALFFALAIRRRRRTSFAYRLKAAFVPPPARPSFLRIIAEKGVATVAGLIATELGRALSKNLIDGRFPTGRLALPAYRMRPEIRVR